MRGRSANPPSFRERQSSRYGPPPRDDPRYMKNGFRGNNTIERERFSKYQDPEECCEDDDIEQQASHMPRRDRMRERQSPPRDRQYMRYSEDRQMGSPRYARGGRKSFS